ncbi:MAG: DNA internalization-related competence protein ComEC/Rec2 [Steroidobacteraceae bacterium]
MRWPVLALLIGMSGSFWLHALPGVGALALWAGLSALCLLVRWRLVGCAGLGFMLACLHGHLRLDGELPCTEQRVRLEASGWITSVPEQRPGKLDFDFQTVGSGPSRTLRVAWYDASEAPAVGERWRLPLRLRCRRAHLNPGVFDRELDLLRRGYAATAYVAPRDGQPRREAVAEGWPVQRMRGAVGAAIAEAVQAPNSAAVLQGLTVGLRGDIPSDLRETFIHTGVAHLIAISGLHVTAFAVVVAWSLKWAFRALGSASWTSAWPTCRTLLVVMATWAYSLLAGASLPTLRTAIAVSMVALVHLARRQVSAADLVAACALAIVLPAPLEMGSAAFWLSFVAVLMLVFAWSSGGLWGFVTLQASLSLALVPVSVAVFGGYSRVGPLVNLVAIPVFSFLLLPLLLLALALMPVWPAAAAGLWAMLGGWLEPTWGLLSKIAAHPLAMSWLAAPPPWLAGLSMLGVLTAVMVPLPATRWLALALLLTLVLQAPGRPGHGEFRLRVLDVGHGLATVLETSRRVMVFDVGPAWQGGSAAAYSLVPYLRSRGLDRLDLAVISHADRDHAGGLDDLTRSLAVAWILGPPEIGADESCVAGRRWHWSGVDFEVLHPAADSTLSGNDASCAILVTAPGCSLLLLADPERRGESALVRQRLRADLVLVPHHGSATSSGAALVATVGARWALVSSGFDDRWGLPKPEVVQRWHAAGAEVLDTGRDGALLFETRRGQCGDGPRGWRAIAGRWWNRR